MKIGLRYLSFVLLIVILTQSMTTVVAATDNEIVKEYVHLDDGSYLEVVVEETNAKALGEKTGRKTYSYKNADGELLWTVTLTGRFSYDTASSVCLSADCSVMISNTAWYVVEKSAEPVKNTATADVTMGKILLGIKVSEIPFELILTCDKNGNLS